MMQIRLLKCGTYDGPIDVLFVEGAISTDEEEHEFREAASRAKIVIAMGLCAHRGGIPAGASKHDVREAQDGMYGKRMQSQGPMVPKPLYAVEGVHIHATIRGCPPDHGEVVRVFRTLLAAGRPELWTQSVCLECALKGNPCVLKQGLPCLGAISVGGCKAECPTQGDSCWGCRGFVNGAERNDYEQHRALRLAHEQLEVPLVQFRKLHLMSHTYQIENEPGYAHAVYGDQLPDTACVTPLQPQESYDV
jgi:coenzyme F420-reducing hydrogenase gamma subunit